MDPRREALDRLGGRYDPRVLEPSPPAAGPPTFTDDPTARGPRGRRSDPQLPVVSPTSSGDLRWQDLVDEDPSLAGWCAERWLAAHRRLTPPPPGLPATRAALHRVAEHVIAPTRQRANGEVTLRYTRGGFGTPFFGDDVQLRVEGDVFVVQQAGGETRGRLTSLKDAAEYVGYDLTRFDAAMADEPLGVDPDAARWLGDLFGFAFSVLEDLRADAARELQGGRVNLWPGSFEVTLELGAEQDGLRATYGVSPGGSRAPEPHLFVAPWDPARPGGALLTLAQLLDAEDQRAAALAFFGRQLAVVTA